MSCSKHPKYKAVRAPAADCAPCRMMWAAAQAATRQPMPFPKGQEPGPCVQDMVIADLEARKAVGLKRYGTLLRPDNGRDALMDLYQELLDACNYCRQALYERNGS